MLVVGSAAVDSDGGADGAAAGARCNDGFGFGF